MKILYSKQAEKYLDKCDAKTYNRILFRHDKTSGNIYIESIHPRGDAYKKG